MEQKNDTKGSFDYFFASGARSFGQTTAGTSFGLCSSRCIQNGKACPLYETCSQKHMIRNILS